MKPIVEVVRRTSIRSDDLASLTLRLRQERRSGELRIIFSQGGVRTIEFIERRLLPVGESA